ncbi:MAG TPA: hypothetical protein VEW74_02885 [Candidatus Nitrosotalea sp.]|nr:hypothetical protein [Candidatus Nitrosotalea sp.]
MSNRTIFLAIALAVLSACGSGKSSSNASSAPNETGAAAATPNCNGESPVWVLPGPKVYLVPGDRLYGKTKSGEYLCLSQAQAEGYRHGRRPFRHHHHGNQPF